MFKEKMENLKMKFEDNKPKLKKVGKGCLIVLAGAGLILIGRGTKRGGNGEMLELTDEDMECDDDDDSDVYHCSEDNDDEPVDDETEEE